MTANTERVKLLLSYDILVETQELYYQYLLGEMVPAAQALGLHMSGAWHTAYGEYPLRLVEFIADDPEQLREVLDGPIWERLERQLLKYITHYKRKVVRLQEDRFQF